MIDYLILILSRFYLLFCFASHVWLTSSSLQEERLVMRMIHHDSIISPSYNKSSTIYDRANFVVKSSTARLAYFKAKKDGASLQDIQGTLVPNPVGNAFLLNFSIGDPPIPQLVIMDTGSGLLWIQCQPCIECQPTICPIYDPRKSSSYAPVSCHNSDCDEIFVGKCDPYGYCAYTVTYQIQTYSTGVIAHERLTFATPNRGISVAPSVLFGCGTRNYVSMDQASGILGLSPNKVSIASSFGSQFSYCIGNISDPNYISNHLVLGKAAIIEGYSTTFQNRDWLYYVSLEGISVGQTKLTIDPERFKFNVVIDTGSTLTYLARSAYEPLKAEVEKIINGSLEPVKIKGFPDLLCYKGDLGRDAQGFPTVTFHLAEGVDIDLGIDGLFFKVAEDTFCMAVNADDSEYNIIGIIAQQYYNVGFDLKAEKVSFKRIDCKALENSFSSIT